MVDSFPMLKPVEEERARCGGCGEAVVGTAVRCLEGDIGGALAGAWRRCGGRVTTIGEVEGGGRRSLLIVSCAIASIGSAECGLTITGAGLPKSFGDVPAKGLNDGAAAGTTTGAVARD